MTGAEQRNAVEAHPPMPVSRTMAPEKHYDLREIALWILDHPDEATYRLHDWWNAPLRPKGPRWHDDGKPVYFLGFELELGAYRLITCACRGEVYAPDDMRTMLVGGSAA